MGALDLLSARCSAVNWVTFARNRSCAYELFFFRQELGAVDGGGGVLHQTRMLRRQRKVSGKKIGDKISAPPDPSRSCFRAKTQRAIGRLGNGLSENSYGQGEASVDVGPTRVAAATLGTRGPRRRILAE